jgi:hypothetical protein
VTDLQIPFLSEVFSVPINDLFPPVPQLGNRKQLQTKHCVTRTSRNRRLKKQNPDVHNNLSPIFVGAFWLKDHQSEMVKKFIAAARQASAT